MSSIFDPIVNAYDEWYDTLAGRAIFWEEARCLRHLTEDYSGRWFEVGVGTGRFASELGITHGVDPAPRMAAIAKRRGVIVRYNGLVCSRHSSCHFIFLYSLCIYQDASA